MDDIEGKFPVGASRCENVDFRSNYETSGLFAQIRPDIVFSLLGVKGSPKAVKDHPSRFFVPQLQFNTNLMDAAMKFGVEWYLYTSSLGVYPKAQIYYEDNMWTDFPSRDDWFGGWAKRMGEVQAEAYNIEGHKNISIVRPTNVYGPHDNFDLENAMVVPSLIRKIMTQKDVEVWGDGSQIRDFMYADDVARAMIHVVEWKMTDPVNIGTGIGTSIRELVDTIVECSNKKVRIHWDLSKPIGDKTRIMNVDRLRNIGFHPQHDLKYGVGETIKWFVENEKTVDNRYNAFKE